MVAIAAIKQPARPATKSAAAKKREAARARKAYIKSATILIEGCRARVTSQFDGDKRYDVRISDGHAESCTCPDRQYRGAYCKHMASVDRRLSLPALPAGIVKFRKVRGKAELVAVAPKEAKITEKPKEVAKPAATERRTARLTKPAQPVEVAIVDRRDIENGGVECDVTDTAGNAGTVTLRRTKRHSCAICNVAGCAHVVHCAQIENARWRVERAEEARLAAIAEKAARSSFSTEERRKNAALTKKQGFNFMRC